MLALTVLQHGNGNFKLNFHRDLREIESFFEACLAAAATLTFLRSLVRHLARFAHARRRFWPLEFLHSSRQTRPEGPVGRLELAGAAL